MLVISWWWIAWFGSGIVRDFYFFPLWTGYTLIVDAFVQFRTGTSHFQRAGIRVAGLFILSMPVWWAFEAINVRLQNWHYLGATSLTSLEYAIRASIAFATVIPAMFVTAEMVRSTNVNPLRRVPPLRDTNRVLVGVHIAGWLMLALMLAWPDLFFWMCWLSLFFILDPISSWLGAPAISRFTSRGDWSPVWNLGVGGVICGFFWEMWNSRAMPKWEYSVPHVDFGYIFEMPVLGYGGYIPFALEVYAAAMIASALLGTRYLPRPRVSNQDER